MSLGLVNKFYVKVGNAKSIKDNSVIMSTNHSLIYFDGWKPWYGSTICLSGPNDRYLKTFKKHLMKAMKYSRDIALEKEYLFLSDADSINTEISPYLFPKIKFDKPSLKYTSICVRKIKTDVSRANLYEDDDGDDDNKSIGEYDEK